MFKKELTLYNLQQLICHKTQPIQTKPIGIFKISIVKTYFANSHPFTHMKLF